MSYPHTVVDPCRPVAVVQLDMGQRSNIGQRAGCDGTGRHIGIFGANPETLVVMDEKRQNTS